MKTLIIGGAGRMGSWLAQYFSEQGHKLIISDIKTEEAKAVAEARGAKLAKNNVEAVKDADLIIVSVPIENAPDVLNEIACHIRKNSIVVDISSLKSHTVKVLAEMEGMDVKPLSVHPLFGPGAQRLKRRVIVVPVIDGLVEKELAKEIFPEAEVIVVEAEEHDRAMAPILALPSFMNMIFASIIGDENFLTLKKMGGTTFTMQLILAESFMFEDPTLLASIQMNNQYTPQYLNKFLSKAETLKEYIINKDKERFTSFYNKVQLSLTNANFSKSYKKMYKMLELLQRV